MRTSIRLLSIAAFLATALYAPAQEAVFASSRKPKTDAPQNFFVDVGGSGGCSFPRKLFELDSSIKNHPDHLDGACLFVAAGYHLKPTVSIALRLFSQEETGSGDWRRLTGNAMQDAFAATASGRTNIKSSGLALILQKEFPINHKLRFFVEGGGGIRKMGNMVVSFSGIATAIDPSDGTSFQVPASDHVGRHIPVGVFGGGMRYMVFPGIQIGPAWEWNTGYSRPLAPFITLRFAPFETFGKRSR